MLPKTERAMISAAIVIYNSDSKALFQAIDSFLNTPLQKKLFIIDNSPSNKFHEKFNHPEIIFLRNERNLGFGKAHNLVLEKIKSLSDYHLVLNPDVHFTSDVIPNLIARLKAEEEVAMIAPKVQYANGYHQYSCRRFPSFLELVVRRIPKGDKLFKEIIENGEYRDKDLSKPFYAEYISGCFQLFKTDEFVKLKGFDPRYFMYMEDVDICRKVISSNKKNLYFPKVTITHKFEKGSAKKIKLFFYHVKSIFQYFYKWKIANKSVNEGIP